MLNSPVCRNTYCVCLDPSLLGATLGEILWHTTYTGTQDQELLSREDRHPWTALPRHRLPRVSATPRLHTAVYLVNLVQVNLPHSPRKSGAGSHRSGKATSGTAAISGILAFRQHRDSCASQACGSQLRHHFWRQCVHSRVRVLHVVCSIEVFPAHVRPGHTLVHPAIRKPAALPLRNRSWESTAD